MKVTALASWFGSNRMLAENVGKALEGRSWVGVPFAGGMSELVHIRANVLLVSDLHRHVINLANCVKHNRRELTAMLDATMFHPDELAKAQARCRERDCRCEPVDGKDLEWASDYFVTSWMSRGGTSGTEGEFDGSMSIRWKSGGGDSAVRFRSAIKALADWEKIAQKCTFVCLDVFDLLDQAHKRDIPENGLYLDPPFPGPGDGYAHKFTTDQHRKLARRLLDFAATRVVCRFYDVPLIRELYPEPAWQWNHLKGRDQANAEKPEVLLVRN
jgi:DNA adenine methylase